MKRYLIFTTVCAGLIIAASFGLAADDLPKPQAFARYEPMMKRSPFAVATAVALPAATPNFAKDLYVANVAHTSDGDLVTVASSTDKNLKKYLTTKAPVEGYKIENIEFSDRVGQTKVTISKDGQTATLTFNQALISQPGANAAAQPNMQPPVPVPMPPQAQPAGVGVPAVPQYANPNAVKPGAVPTLPTPPPRVRGVIQRKPDGGAVPQPEPQAVPVDE
jgi:hypothetical protein